MAESYGLAGEFWTCDRVALVLDEEFGVRYSRREHMLLIFID